MRCCRNGEACVVLACTFIPVVALMCLANADIRSAHVYFATQWVAVPGGCTVTDVLPVSYNWCSSSSNNQTIPNAALITVRHGGMLAAACCIGDDMNTAIPFLKELYCTRPIGALPMPDFMACSKSRNCAQTVVTHVADCVVRDAGTRRAVALLNNTPNAGHIAYILRCSMIVFNVSLITISVLIALCLPWCRWRVARVITAEKEV